MNYPEQFLSSQIQESEQKNGANPSYNYKFCVN